MNAAVNKAFEIEEFQNVLSKIKNIQNITSHSWKINRELEALQKNLNLPTKKIPSYSKTRWWSLLNLMCVIVEQEMTLYSLLSKYKNGQYKKYILSNSEINLLKETMELLIPIQQTSDHLAGEKYVTESAILPIYKNLKSKLEIMEAETELDEELTYIKDKIITSIVTTFEDRYINNDQTKTTLMVSTFLDPRFTDYFIN